MYYIPMMVRFNFAQVHMHDLKISSNGLMIEKIINDHKKDAQNLNEIKSFFKTYELHKILLSIRPDNYIPEHLYSFHVDNLERKIQFGYQKILAFIIHQD